MMGVRGMEAQTCSPVTPRAVVAGFDQQHVSVTGPLRDRAGQYAELQSIRLRRQ